MKTIPTISAFEKNNYQQYTQKGAEGPEKAHRTTRIKQLQKAFNHRLTFEHTDDLSRSSFRDE